MDNEIRKVIFREMIRKKWLQEKLLQKWISKNADLIRTIPATSLEQITDYSVKYLDLRELKPREPRFKIMVYDCDILKALELVGQNLTDHIETRFAKGGYKVLEIKKLALPPLELIWVSKSAKNLVTKNNVSYLQYTPVSFWPGIFLLHYCNFFW